MKKYIRSKTLKLSSEKENVRLDIKSSEDGIPRGSGERKQEVGEWLGV